MFSNFVESRIRGGINHAQIRVKDEPVWAIRDKIDVLIALSQESFDFHCQAGDQDTIILFDQDEIEIPDGLNYTGKLAGIPLAKIAKQNGGQKVMANVVGAGAALTLLGVELDSLKDVIQKTIGKKVEENVSAGIRGKKFAEENFSALIRKEKGSKQKTDQKHLLITGNEAMAIGAINANCRVVAGYPMTPASSLFEYFFKKAEKMDLVAIQAESEVSGMNTIAGAAYMGVRTLTATSGGGFDLMTEAFSFTGMAELPVVVAEVCRPGPSTGLPTRTEQSDLVLAMYGGHGEFPRIIFAPKDPIDGFYLIQRAFNMSDKYQTPALVLSDQYMSMSSFTVEQGELDPTRIPIEGKKSPGKDFAPKEFHRYLDTPDGVSPWVNPGETEAIVLATGDEHDERGWYSELIEVRNKMHEKRMRKLEHILQEIDPPEVLKSGGAPSFVFVSWGSSYGPLHEVCQILKARGVETWLVHFTQLWPLPGAAVRSIFADCGDVPLVFVEGNFTGQFQRLLAEEIGIREGKAIRRYDGRPFTVEYILEHLQEMELI